jgi:hypothetical protein
MLTSICKVEDKVEIHCTAGTVSTNLMGALNGYGDVWYHADGIANILSLSQICSRGYIVSFARDTDNQFHVKNVMVVQGFSSSLAKDYIT